MGKLTLTIARRASTDQVFMELPLKSQERAQDVEYTAFWGKCKATFQAGTNTLSPNMTKALLKLYAEGKIDKAMFEYVSEDGMTRHHQVIRGNWLRTIL